MTEKEAYVAFNLTEQIGSVGVEALIRRYGSVITAWEAYPKKVARAGGEVNWVGEFKKAKQYGVTILTPADADYPTRLKDSPGRPLALYVKGSVAALQKSAIAIVGTRRPTAYGLDQAHKFAKDLVAADWCIVSGLALGIDGEAHRGALDGQGVTVGVLGSGLDQFYPEQNRDLAREIVEKGGAVISEFPFGRKPDTQTFPQRNHVVAALAVGVLAIEAPHKSGTLLTTSIAADLGRTVMAVPCRVDSRTGAGCLQLIREGAVLVRDARDVNEALGELIPVRPMPEATSPSSQPPRTLEAPYTLEESLIMRYIDEEGISMDELVRQSGLSIAKVNSLCMTLRIRGRVRFFPGNRVALPRQH